MIFWLAFKTLIIKFKYLSNYASDMCGERSSYDQFNMYLKRGLRYQNDERHDKHGEKFKFIHNNKQSIS